MSTHTLSAPIESAQYAGTLRYPAALLDLLELQFGPLSGKQGTVLCNGSPHLAELFLQRRESITLVEQDEAVRAHIQARILTFGQSPAVFTDGTPLMTDLSSASQEFIAADRLLFREDAAEIALEFRRILRPGAPVLLITDNRVYNGDRQTEEYETILRAHCPGFREKAVTVRIPRAVQAFFHSATVHEDAFIGQQVLTFPALLAQTRALPIYPSCEGKLRTSLEADLALYFKRWALENAITIPTICRIAYGTMA